MDWHCINLKRGGSRDAGAADFVPALEDAYDGAGEPAAADVFLSQGTAEDHAFYLSPERASMAPGVLQRFNAVLCDPPADLHRCTPMRLRDSKAKPR